MSLETVPSVSLATSLTKDEHLHRRSDHPFILDPPLAILNEAVTPVERLFARHRQPIPDLQPAHWELTIDGLVRHPLTIDYRDLLREPVSSFFAALIGRHDDHDGYAAIANAEWIGAPLALFLEAAGVKPQAGFAACWSYGPQPVVQYVPLAKLWQDGMLAYAINGRPLPALHGGPVRLVVPGWAGAYWLKWIERMTLISPESAPPAAFADGSLRIDCRLFNLAEATRGNSLQPLRGVAWSAAQGITRVALSFDEGPWQDAILDSDLGPRAWRRFTCAWPAAGGSHQLAVQITDGAGQTAVRYWRMSSLAT
ncbi:MAG: molybdopterin-dependent oxidoreductase [Chloroflexus sp.]|nr:molybdopterin-dependent oxidoreductase [Chloroflexus sp.]